MESEGPIIIFPCAVFLNENCMKTEQVFCTKWKDGKGEAVWRPQLLSFSVIHGALLEPGAISWQEKYQKHIQ